MSIRYRDKNGAERVISGLTPGGDIEYGAVATRKGTITCADSSTQSYSQQDVTFTEPMPDSNYVIEIQPARGNWEVEQWTCVGKTASGFTFVVHNINHTAPFVATSFYYNAFKLYTVADAEALYSTVQDIEAMVPDSASSTNKFATANDLRTETRSLDRRLDDVEDVIPSNADISNKLVTESDLSNVQIDKVEDINDVELTDIADGQTLVWDDENSKWVNGAGGKTYTAGDGIEIDSNDAISVADTYKTIFVGTRAQWDALSATDKIKYNEAHITDDVIGGEVADEVTDGLMSPVTSNAVYDYFIDSIVDGQHRPPTSNAVFDQLKNFCMTVQASGSLTIDGNGQQGISLTYTCPQGYTPVLAVPHSAGSWAWVWSYCHLQDTSHVYAVIKSTNTFQETQTIYANVLCVRTYS